MNKSQKILEKLKSSCGLPVRRACLEVYFGVGEIRGEIFIVGVELTNGLNVKFGCAGSGDVLINKGQCSSSEIAEGEEIQVRDLFQSEGSVLEEVESFESVVKLKFSTGIMEIENADDMLDVTYNDKHLHEEAITHRELT